jgi:hypothetical protein
MKSKDTIAWECAGCGHRHLWKWRKGEADTVPITMFCDRCDSSTLTELVRIGKRAWAALWPGR